MNPFDCFLTIDTTVTGRGRPVENGARTSLLYGLFHRDSDFQQQFDATTVFVGVGTAVEFGGNQPASSNGGFFEASEVEINEHRVVLNTPISNTNIGLVLVQARIDSSGTLVTSRTDVISGYESIPIHYPEYTDAWIVHPTGVEIPFQFQLGFNPLRSFNQTFTSPDCINVDRPRFFPDTTTVEHYENLEIGSTVAVVFANDSDAGPNADVQYMLYNASAEIRRTFAINETTGEVTLLSSLNREQMHTFFIGLEASDRGVVNSFSGFGELIVRVLDVNDENPVFDENPYISPSVPEDADIGYSVVTVNAEDADLGENATVSYMLLEPKYAFDVNSTSGEVFTVSTLDYESQQQYTLVVVANDNGFPSLSSNTTLIINIDPVNDNAPECNPTERLALVSETESNGTAFFIVNVSDADLGADHSVLSFALAEESSEFGVVKINDNLAALVTITEDLDRLVRPNYNIVIVVSDVDGKSCSIEVSLIVVEPPIFDFTIERPGAGFFTGSIQQIRNQNSFLQEVNFFGNSFSNGTVSGSLNGQTNRTTYVRSPQPPTRLNGILHEDEVWPDKPYITAAIQLRDASFNTVVDDTEVVIQIQPNSPNSTVSPVSGSPCERESSSLSGICAAEVEVPPSWFAMYSSVNVTVSTREVSVSLGQVDLMPVTEDASDYPENLVIELPSYTLYPDTNFTVWVGAAQSIDIKAFQFTLQVPSSIQLGSIVQDNKWGCTQDYDEVNNRANFVCFRSLPGESQESLIGTDRFFGVQASVSGEITDFEDVTVQADVTSIASTFGSIISTTKPALIFTRNNISSSPQMLNLEQLQVRGIFASTERPELVNTVPLNREPVTIPITAYSVYNRLHPRFGAMVSDPLECSSSDSNIVTQSNCSINLTTEFSSCGSETAVAVTHIQSFFTFSLPLRIWCYNSSEIDLSDPVLDRVTNWKTESCSEDRFQQSRVRIMGWFASGDEVSRRVDITEYLADELVSSNDSIAVVDGASRTVSGIAEGMAEISLSSLPEVSTLVEVVENYVEVYTMLTNVFTSVSLQANPSTYTPTSALTVSAVLGSSFENVNVEGYTAAYVYFTDGALYVIPQSSLNTTTLTPTTIAMTSEGVIQSISQGSAQVEISWIPAECSMQETLASDIAIFEVTTPVPVDLVLDISDEVIAGNTRGVPGLGVASMSIVTASLVYSNGSTRRLQPSEYTITSSSSLVVMGDGGNTIITANRTVNATSGSLTVLYTTAGGDEIRRDATFTIISVLSAEIGLLSYPDAVDPPAMAITLEILPVGNDLQQAQVYAQARLSNGSEYSIPPSELTFTRRGAGSVSVNNDGIITGLSNGGALLDFTVGELTLPTVVVDVSGVRVRAQSIGQLQLEDLSPTQKRVVVDLNFTDGSVIRDIINYRPELVSLVQFSISPPEVATIDPATLILTITRNHYNLVNLTATTVPPNVHSASIQFAANLEPALGELDLGRLVGIPQPPVSVNDVFSTDVRVNIGQSGNIGAFHLITAYEPDDLAAVSISLSLPGVYIFNADTENGVIHVMYLSVFGTQIDESEPTIASFNFRALSDNTLTTVTSNLCVFIDDSISPIATHGPASIDIMIGSAVSRRSRRDSPCAPRHTGTTTPDVNGDDRTNIADAAYLMRYIGEGEGSVTLSTADADEDGVITVADVLFLARASAGLVPFLDSLTITPATSDSDCSLTIQAEVTFSTEEFTNNDTSLYFVLSHPEYENIIAVSNALVGSKLPVSDETSVIFKAATSQTRGAYRLTLNTPLDSQANNVGVSVMVLTEDDDIISSGLDRLAVFKKAQMTTFVSDGELIPALRDVRVDPDFASIDILDPDGFSPFETFTNNERSDYCRFADSTFSISLLESIAVGEVVFNFTAYEPPFPSYMENYTIISTTEEGHFTLESNTGVLQLAETLDFETIPSYNLTVNAYSELGEYNIGQVTLEITVLDLNDFPPQFIAPETYTTNLTEDATPNTNAPIFTVSARDLDDGVNGQFSFSLQDSSVTFNISSDGDLFLVGSLDRETIEVYNLTVYAIDMGIPVLSSSASVLITVLDVNDNSPIFNETEYNVTIRESIFTVETGNVIVPDFRIVATDADAGENAIVLLTLDPENLEPSKPFSLSSDGVLSVTSVLDRESRAHYSYSVLASDMGTEPRSSFVELNIIIEDSNDHPPVFSPSNEVMIILEEDIPVGTSITTILANDSDIGTNAEITFSILPTSAPFSIDSSGVITVSRSLNVNDTHEYNLQINARNDRGDVPQSANSTLVISVLEKQVVLFDVGNKGFLTGEPQRLTGGRRYIQQVGALFNENIGTPVSVSGGINTAISGEIDQAELTNSGDVAVGLKGSVLDSRVRHSLRTVTIFIQAFDARDVIARSTVIEVNVIPSVQLRDLSPTPSVTETCTTSEDLGFCIIRVRLPDEWFERDTTDETADTVTVWARLTSESGPGRVLADNLVVEHSPAHAVSYTVNPVILIEPSHQIYPGQNFSIEIYVASPLDITYNRVQADIINTSPVGINYDDKTWYCGK